MARLVPMTVPEGPQVPAACTVPGCEKEADVMIGDAEARCSFHYMQAADGSKQGGMYSRAGWQDRERAARLGAYLELLRDQMMRPEAHQGVGSKEKMAVRRIALRALSNATRGFK